MAVGCGCSVSPSVYISLTSLISLLGKLRFLRHGLLHEFAIASLLVDGCSTITHLLIHASKFGAFSSRCSITNSDTQFNDVATSCVAQENSSAVETNYSVPIVHIKSDILETECLGLLAEENYVSCLFTALPVLSEQEQHALAATPAHPAGFYGKSLFQTVQLKLVSD